MSHQIEPWTDVTLGLARGKPVKRIDHLLFQADADFIAYFDALPVPGGDCDYHDHCGQFAHFLISQAQLKKDVRGALDAIEAILKDGGWNAEQLRRSFFPTLHRELKWRPLFEVQLGVLSKAAWDRLDTNERPPVI